YLLDLVGDQPPRLLREATAEVEFGPGEFSPDGTRALIGRYRTWTETASLAAGAELLDLATGESHPVWPELDHWIDPVWLDDTTLVATTDDQGRGSVWIGRAEDPAPRRLAGGPEQELAFSSASVAGGAVIAAASGIAVAPHPVRIDPATRSEEHTSELQSRFDLVCRLLLRQDSLLALSLPDALPISPRTTRAAARCGSAERRIPHRAGSLAAPSRSSPSPPPPSRAVRSSPPPPGSPSPRTRCGSTPPRDRKSTRLNSSHVSISYAGCCSAKTLSSPFPYPTLFRSHHGRPGPRLGVDRPSGGSRPAPARWRPRAGARLLLRLRRGRCGHRRRLRDRRRPAPGADRPRH